MDPLDPRERLDRLDRHALAMAVWLPLGLVALALLRLGLGAGGWPWLAGGFAALLAAFVLHVVLNAATGTDFTAGEVALGLLAYAAGVLAAGLGRLLDAGFAARGFLPVALGLAGLGAAGVAYMLTRYGARAAFERFDVARQANRRPAADLPHRGGRR